MSRAVHARFIGALLAEGGAALQRGDWAAARALFADAVEREDTPEARYGLARAFEWAGDFAAAVRSYELAFAGYRARGEVRLPALIAGRELAFLHAAVYGNETAAGSWLARSRSLVEESGNCPERGWVELAEALATDDPDEITAHAQAAAAVAGSFGDVDLRFCAMAYEGTGDVLRGRVDEGMRLVDEAALAATAGEVRDHLVVGEIYCKLLLCCESALDVRRAQEWITVADAAGRASHDLWVSAICRMYYGGILTAAGRWQEAEDALCAALSIYDDGMRALRSGAAVRLADLRVRQGRLEEAGRLLAGNEFDGQAALPLARLHLIRGEVELAATVLRRSLSSATTTVLHAPALALLAEVRAAGRDRAEARQVYDRLEGLAASSGLRHVRALAERVDGLLRGAEGLAHLEAALRLFASAGLPWEAARTRMSIAHLLAGTLPEVAVAESRAALEVFRALGAGRDADEAAGQLRSLGSRAGPIPRAAGVLTRREREVLGLLVEGLSNQQIADRLFLSKRTVEHHVGAILAKIGAGTRAEALAHAVRHGVE